MLKANKEEEDVTCGKLRSDVVTREKTQDIQSALNKRDEFLNT